MSQRMSLIVVVVILVATGLVCGFLSNRWGVAADLLQEKHMALPVSVGDWDSRDDPVSPLVFKIAQVSSMERRWYHNRNTGAMLSVTLIFGPSGPVAVHTPDVCFRNSGFEETTPAIIRTIEPGLSDRFCARRFHKQLPAPLSQSVHYAWNAGGGWEVRDNPRIAYAGQRTLYKLYVNCETTGDTSPEADQSAVEFLRLLLPILRPATNSHP